MRTRDGVHMDYPGHCDPCLFEPKGIMSIVYSARSLGRDPRTKPANIFSRVWYQSGIKALALHCVSGRYISCVGGCARFPLRRPFLETLDRNKEQSLRFPLETILWV